MLACIIAVTISHFSFSCQPSWQNFNQLEYCWIHAFFTSCLDYCNGLYARCSA